MRCNIIIFYELGCLAARLDFFFVAFGCGSDDLLFIQSSISKSIYLKLHFQCFLTMNKPRSCFCVFQMKKMTCSWIGNNVFVIGRRYCVQSRAWWKWDECIVFTDECTKWFRDQGKHLINFCELNIQSSHQIGRYSFVQIA